MDEVGRLWRDAGVLRGSGDGVGTPRAREGAWDPREPRGESEAWPQRLPLPPRAPTMGPDRVRPRPRFTAGECLLRTPRTGGRRFPHRGGGSSSGGLRPQRSHSIFGWFPRDWRVEAAGSKSAALWQGGGFAGEARLLASQAGHGPDSPREDRSVDEGPAHAPAGTAPPGAEPWPAPLPGPRSLVLPWHSASAGVGELPASVVHGKTHGPLGGREGFR